MRKRGEENRKKKMSRVMERQQQREKSERRE